MLIMAEEKVFIEQKCDRNDWNTVCITTLVQVLQWIDHEKNYMYAWSIDSKIECEEDAQDPHAREVVAILFFIL
jgi:hypothetical protein